MSVSRLSLALEEGLFALPEGPVCVWGAAPGRDLSALPRNAHLVSTFRPHVDALRAAGWQVDPVAPDGEIALGIVFVPREKELARETVAEAARRSRGPVVLDGAKSDGIESLLKALRGRAALSPFLSKAHGKLAVLAPGAGLSDWEDPGPRDIGGGLVTLAGVFSADAPDPASRVLAEALPGRLGARVADLGAGWGYLSRAVLAREGVERVDLVEADLRALDCARRNVTDPRAEFHWADATDFGEKQGYDTVVMNPPFHEGSAADPEIGRAFIQTASRLLKPKGQVWLVANRHLPYEKALAEAFGEVSETGGDRSFKLFRAARPRQQGAIA